MGSSASGFTRDSFREEEIDQLFADSGLQSNFVFAKLQQNGVVSFDSLKEFIDSMSDCFLSHDWGEGESNHERT